MRKKYGLAVCYALVIVAAALFIAIGNRVASRDLTIFKEGNQTKGVPVRVTHVTGREQDSYGMGGEEFFLEIIFFEGIVTGGEYKGLGIEGRQMEDPLLPVPLKEVSEGDRVLLYEMGKDEDGATVWVLQEYIRSNALIVLTLLFALLLLVFGRLKGMFTILSLSFTCLGIFLVLIPAVLSGYNIYLATAAVCLFIIVTALTLVNGFNYKSLSAGIGCAGGILTSGLLLVIMNRFLRLTGLMDEDSYYLLYLRPDQPLDLKAIVFCSIVIGALGATLDVSVSIASSLSEIAEASQADMSLRDIFKSGISIGRDIMGTMANTLILAYIGGSMSIVLLLIVYSNSLLELFNREMIVVEILQSLIGSIGLLVTIPITTLFWGLLETRMKKRTLPEADSGMIGPDVQ